MLAASEKGGLTHAPDTYLEKLAVGPSPRAASTSPDRPRRTATGSPRRSGASPDITVIILDRPRHETLIAEVRSTGARLRAVLAGNAEHVDDATEAVGEELLDGLLGFRALPFVR